MSCDPAPLNPVELAAVARFDDLELTHEFRDPDASLPPLTMKFGRDFEHGRGGALPEGLVEVGSDEATLKRKMRVLLGAFAGNDPHGKARRLFDAFLSKQARPKIWRDDDLDATGRSHGNMVHFARAALNDPAWSKHDPGRRRIHQALRRARWDVRGIVPPRDLGVPAFNRGRKYLGTVDYNNGLVLMINGVQHVHVFATGYRHEPGQNRYCVRLRYALYDVFGLDDEDVRVFGADGGFFGDRPASEGFTAWWQLQHQFDYAPLVTRVNFTREFTAATD